jgi:hypothetical protein
MPYQEQIGLFADWIDPFWTVTVDNILGTLVDELRQLVSIHIQEEWIGNERMDNCVIESEIIKSDHLLATIHEGDQLLQVIARFMDDENVFVQGNDINRHTSETVLQGFNVICYSHLFNK